MLFSYSSSFLKYKSSSMSSQYIYFKILDFLIFPYVSNIFLLKPRALVGRPHNNCKNRTQIDCMSALKLCYALFLRTRHYQTLLKAIIVQKTDSTTKITVRTIFFPPFIAKYSLCISKLSGYFFCAFLSLSS